MTRFLIIISCLGVLVHAAGADDDKPTEGPTVGVSAEGEGAVSADSKEEKAASPGSEKEGTSSKDKAVDEAVSVEAKPTYPAGLETEDQRISYAVGVSVGRGLKRDGARLDVDIVAKGFRDAYAGGELQLTNDQIRESIIALKRELAANDLKARIEAASKSEPPSP